MASVTGVSPGDYYLPGNKARVPRKELDQTDFLALIIAQLKNQDPLEPQSNEEFISQMAQMTALETMTHLYAVAEYTHATQLIGKEVTISRPDTEVKGIVEKVSVMDSRIKVCVNGSYYDVALVVQVENPDVG